MKRKITKSVTAATKPMMTASAQVGRELPGPFLDESDRVVEKLAGGEETVEFGVRGAMVWG